MPSRSSSKFALAMAVVLIVALVVPASALSVDKKPAGSVGAQAVVFPDMYEPNASIAEAKKMPGPYVDANLTNEYDEDYFYFTVEDTGTPIVIETEFPYDGLGEGYDTGIVLYGPGGVVLDSNDDHGWWSTYSSFIEYEVTEPGTYYVNVYSISDDPMYYRLWVTQGSARRLAGADRYETNTLVTHRIWDTADSTYDYPYIDTVIIASGVNVPDALAASSLLDGQNRALLITDPLALPASIERELVRLAFCAHLQDVTLNVWIMGGTSAVSAAVEAKIKTLDFIRPSDVVRMAGANRFATAAEIADVLDNELGEYGGSVIVANGNRWPDALSAGPVAANNSYPILLAKADSLPTETAAALTALTPMNVYVIGGTAVVSDDVVDDIEAITGIGTVTRIAGADRYETAYEVADYWYAGPYQAILVCGETSRFPDALSSVQLAEGMGVPMLMTPSASLSPWVTQYFDDGLGFDSHYNFAIGGTAAISPAALKAYNELWMDYLP